MTYANSSCSHSVLLSQATINQISNCRVCAICDNKNMNSIFFVSLLFLSIAFNIENDFHSNDFRFFINFFSVRICWLARAHILIISICKLHNNNNNCQHTCCFYFEYQLFSRRHRKSNICVLSTTHRAHIIDKRHEK